MPLQRKAARQQVTRPDQKRAKVLLKKQEVDAAELLEKDGKIARDLLVRNGNDAAELLNQGLEIAVDLLEKKQKTAAALLVVQKDKQKTPGSRAKTASKLSQEQQKASDTLRTFQRQSAKLLRHKQQKASDMLRKLQEQSAKLLRGQQMKAAAVLEQIQVIIQSSNDAIIGTTLSGVITSWNRGAEKMFGYSSKEVIGKSGSRLFPPEMWSRVPKLLKKIKRKEVVADYDISGLRKDGTRFDMAISISPIVTGDGTVIGASVVERDITERKKAEARLIFTQALLDRSNDGIQVINLRTLRYVEVNEATTSHLGYTREELLEMTVPDIAPFIPAPMMADVRAKMIAKKPALFEAIERRKDGTTFPVEVHVQMVPRDGIPYGIAIVRDITERKKSEERVKESDYLKSKFIQIVSHQFRTPLNVIRWNLEALMGENLGALKPEQKEFVRITHDADVEVINLMGDLLTVMDIEEGRVQLEKSDIAVESLVASVFGTFKERCAAHDITCAYRLPTTALPTVSIDPEKIRSVIEKLVTNAIAYTPDHRNIVASISTKKNFIRFEIVDAGIGIPAVEQSRIFTRFFRASNASVMQPNASGLGLCIAKYFVEMHGGTIGFQSVEGKGTTFWFELPVSPG